jgi:hypothetical protein
VRRLNRQYGVPAAENFLSLADRKRLWKIGGAHCILKDTDCGRRSGQPARPGNPGRTLTREPTPSGLIFATVLYLTKLIILTYESVRQLAGNYRRYELARAGGGGLDRHDHHITLATAS